MFLQWNVHKESKQRKLQLIKCLWSAKTLRSVSSAQPRLSSAQNLSIQSVADELGSNVLANIRELDHRVKSCFSSQSKALGLILSTSSTSWVINERNGAERRTVWRSAVSLLCASMDRKQQRACLTSSSAEILVGLPVLCKRQHGLAASLQPQVPEGACIASVARRHRVKLWGQLPMELSWSSIIAQKMKSKKWRNQTHSSGPNAYGIYCRHRRQHDENHAGHRWQHAGKDRYAAEAKHRRESGYGQPDILPAEKVLPLFNN